MYQEKYRRFAIGKCLHTQRQYKLEMCTYVAQLFSLKVGTLTLVPHYYTGTTLGSVEALYLYLINPLYMRIKSHNFGVSTLPFAIHATSASVVKLEYSL